MVAAAKREPVVNGGKDPLLVRGRQTRPLAEHFFAASRKSVDSSSFGHCPKMLEAIFLKENLTFMAPSRPQRNLSVVRLAELCSALLFVVLSLIIALIVRSLQVSNMQVKGMEIITGNILKSSSRRLQLTGVDVWGNADVLIAHDACKTGRIGTSKRLFIDDVEVLFGMADVEQFAFGINNAKTALFSSIGKLLFKVPWKEKREIVCLSRRVGVLL
ncbi:hypothetical protein HPP92_004562 [Vanilla planifolia]|uniref:Uncharacterized protein n=1 Tax=Vanilla planifolia TaxID=51239 RepID=A0A835VKF8_VANPL|nr:hypothetical protein HPP92_004562 [Vanilla planifolia]